MSWSAILTTISKTKQELRNKITIQLKKKNQDNNILNYGMKLDLRI